MEYERERERERDRDKGFGPAFSEKKEYKPNVVIEYVDESGRVMNPKEAFRHLSHRFHGKGSGKTKKEKRMKKIEEERQALSAVNTLQATGGTFAELQEKRKEAGVAYVELKGFSTDSKRIGPPIKKPKIGKEDTLGSLY
eukprot:Opistho-1_new@30456